MLILQVDSRCRLIFILDIMIICQTAGGECLYDRYDKMAKRVLFIIIMNMAKGIVVNFYCNYRL